MILILFIFSIYLLKKNDDSVIYEILVLATGSTALITLLLTIFFYAFHANGISRYKETVVELKEKNEILTEIPKNTKLYERILKDIGHLEAVQKDQLDKIDKDGSTFCGAQRFYFPWWEDCE